MTRSRAHAAVDLALERSRSASRDRERGQTTLFSLLENRAGGEEVPEKLDEYPPRDPWDLRETLKREKQALGFYVSGHPLDRYGKELRRFDVTPTSRSPGLAQWDKVRVAGVVENYRDRIFRNGGGRVAFFELEDEVGQRRRQDSARNGSKRALRSHLRASRCSSRAKCRFPWAPRKTPTTTPPRSRPSCSSRCSRSPTPSKPRPAASPSGSPPSAPARPFAELERPTQRSPGSCPVSVVIELGDGAEAVLALGTSLKVTPSDAMLAGLERLFGENVAELR